MAVMKTKPEGPLGTRWKMQGRFEDDGNDLTIKGAAEGTEAEWDTSMSARYVDFTLQVKFHW